MAELRCLSLLRVNAADLDRQLLPALLPAGWRGGPRLQAPWHGGNGEHADGVAAPGSRRWMQLLWQLLLQFDELAVLHQWPLLATQGEEVGVICALPVRTIRGVPLGWM